MSMTDIITMKSTDLDFLLSNHELFTHNEVKLAAKRKVILGKIEHIAIVRSDFFEDLALNAQANINNPLGYSGQAQTGVFGDLFGRGF